MPRSRRTTGSMPFPTSGPSRSASAAGDSTGPATVTSPGGRPSCSAAATCGSSPATWAVPVRCAPFRNGQSVATTMGMSPQSGLPQNNRVGDFDAFALPRIMRADRQVARGSAVDPGQPERSAGHQRREHRLPRHRRGRRQAATPGRSWLWTFTPPACGITWGPIWSNWAGPTRLSLPAASAKTAMTCGPPFATTWPSWASCSIPAANQQARGEVSIHAPQSRVQIWVMPTNEELVVARLAAKLLKG